MASKLEQLQQKKAALELQIARERTKAKNAQRRIDDRRKILLGAFMLDQLQKKSADPAKLIYDGVSFADWLVRDDERELFGLASKATPKPAPKVEVKPDVKPPLRTSGQFEPRPDREL